MDIILSLISFISLLIGVIYQWKSKKELDKNIKDMDVQFEEFKKAATHIKISGNASIKVTGINGDVITYTKDDRVITYVKYKKSHDFVQHIGRVSRLSEKQPLYIKLWIFLNSGLINTMLNGIFSGDKFLSMDNASVIGMLVGEKIRKDTKSYIIILVSLLLSLSIPFALGVAINLWLVVLVSIMFLLLVINHKVLEYRISNGLYGNNAYEVREILEYIESYSSDDDFTGFEQEKVFPQEKNGNDEYVGVLGGLIN